MVSKTHLLMISHSNARGGAARAALRLFYCLTQDSIKVEFLVVKKQGQDERIITVSPVQKIAAVFVSRFDKIICNILEPGGTNWKTGALIGVVYAKSLNKNDCNVINLHWLGHGLISLRQLNKIKKPVIWTLHDEWLLNAISHYPEVHNRKKTFFNFIKRYFLERRVQAKKKFILKDNVHLVTINSSIARQIKVWCPTIKKKIYTVPNPVNTSEFYPMPVKNIKKLMGFSTSKPILLFLGGTGDVRKGWDLLEQALDYCNSNFDLFMIGDPARSNYGKAGQININGFPKITQNIELCALYSIATAVVIPSRHEGLPQVATEALCCGTPIIGFDISGLKDLIIEGKNGYIIPSFDTQKLANIIDKVIGHGKNNYTEFCYEFAIKEFSFESVSQKYKKIINQI